MLRAGSPGTSRTGGQVRHAARPRARHVRYPSVRLMDAPHPSPIYTILVHDNMSVSAHACPVTVASHAVRAPASRPVFACLVDREAP